jgi:hypothetical protein
VVSGEGSVAGSRAEEVSDVPARYVLSSDPQLVAAHQAEAMDQARLLNERREGEFLVTYQTPGGWVAISKDLLTEVLGVGRSARVAGLPEAAAGVLARMLRELAVPA